MVRSISRREWIAFAAVVAVFWLLRFPMYGQPGLLLGWHSDAAVFGLMARDIYEGTFHYFWWGQSYLGTLTQIFGALGGAIVAPFGVDPPVGPLGMRVGTAIEWIAGAGFYWLALRTAFGPAVAIVTALLMMMGPDWFFHSQLAPRGAEMHLFMSGALLLLFAATDLRRRRDWLIFGLLSGLGWWFHQGVVFTIAAILAVKAAAAFSLWRRRPGQRSAAWKANIVARAIDIVLIVWLATSVVHEFIPAVPAFFLHNPVLEPLTIWLIFRAIAAVAFDGPARDAIADAWHARSAWLPKGALFLAGALAAYSPILIARARGEFEGTYGLGFALRSLSDALRQLGHVVRSDFWSLIGASLSPSGAVIAIVLVTLLVVRVVRWRGTLAYGLRGVAALSVVFSFLFYVASPRAFAGAVRYLMPVLPILWAFALAEAEEWWRSGSRAARLAAAVCVVALAGTYAVQTLRLVDDLRSARAEGRFYTGAAVAAGPSFDPRPVIAEIERGGWRICYAPFAVGMNLEWLMDRRVRFISHQSVEPRRALARQLAARPERKCSVSWQGEVREWDPAAEGGGTWNPLPNLPGAYRRDLLGAPGRPGPFRFQLRVPAGAHSAGHRHPVDVEVRILRGSIDIVIGEPLDRSRAQRFTAGSSFVVPANAWHEEWWDEESLMEGSGTGPFSTLRRSF
jgi:hypothetical protein